MKTTIPIADFKIEYIEEIKKFQVTCQFELNVRNFVTLNEAFDYIKKDTELKLIETGFETN